MDEVFTTPVPEMTLEAANKKIEYLQHMIDAYMIPIEVHAELREKKIATEKSFNVLEHSYYKVLRENDQLKEQQAALMLENFKLSEEINNLHRA